METILGIFNTGFEILIISTIIGFVVTLACLAFATFMTGIPVKDMTKTQIRQIRAIAFTTLLICTLVGIIYVGF